MTWDLAPDSKHIAVLTRVESGEASEAEHEVAFFANFFDELRRLTVALTNDS
jgi:hypothetical protein